jgi:hypothetical protein
LTTFGVTDALEPPPAPTKTLTASVATKDENPTQGSLPIEAGYVVQAIRVGGWFNWDDNGGDTSGPLVYVGDNVFDLRDRKTDLSFKGNPMNGKGEATSLAWSVNNPRGEINYNVNIEAKCVLTQEALLSWKQKIHAAILTARAKMVSNYNDAVSRLALQQQVSPVQLGTNPDANRQTERTELKKAAIAMLANFDLTAFGAVIDQAGQPAQFASFLPALPAALAQGRIVRFFEEAFEWENMAYFLYPYFWGRKETWQRHSTLTNGDPLFAQFLQAGAARVVVPVRPSFVPDVGYYVMTGELWHGGTLPTISDQDYLPIAEEIRAAQGGDDDGVPVGEPWEYRLPTDLVRVRADSVLPTWTRQDDPHRTTAGPWQCKADN